MLDSSGSEGAVNFQKQLEFVNMIVNEFSYDGTDHTQVRRNKSLKLLSVLWIETNVQNS